MMTIAAVLAAATAVSTTATASATAAPHQGSVAVAHAPQPGAPADRDVHREPAVKPAEQTLSPGCYSSTLGPRVPLRCQIHEPVVNAPETRYPLLLWPGQHVTVYAGGCVQTGGSGATWKRYVDPASDSDLYHGLITIPGTTARGERLVNVVGRELTVGGPVGSPAVNLSLGYQDDGYSDNGYYARNNDNGTGNQCLNSFNAYVDVFVS
jgi:hypothetical protein